MDDDEYRRRKALTFEQAEGAAPLPSQLAIGEVSAPLRARLWHLVYESYKQAEDSTSWRIKAPWHQILLDKHVKQDAKMADDFRNDIRHHVAELKAEFPRDDFIRLFGFLQWLVRHPACQSGLAKKIDNVLIEERAAYRLVGGDTIVPVASETERQTVERAFASTATSQFQGARART